MIWAVSLLTTKLISRSLTPVLSRYGIRSLIEFGRLVDPLALSLLYLHNETHEASPKAISRRTSYCRVCLAFHPYPQLIRYLFNGKQFGPPLDFTPASAWPWIDHSASGLQHATERPVQTRFRSGSPSRVNLATYHNSLAHSSKGTPSWLSQKG